MWAVGVEIRECRTATGLSQEELSARTGISRNMLSPFELGQHNPAFLKMFALFKELDLTSSVMFDRAERRLHKLSRPFPAVLDIFAFLIERDAILKEFEQTRFNKTAATKVLGLSFRTLRYRIKKLGMEW